jgi:hypothetical protein
MTSAEPLDSVQTFTGRQVRGCEENAMNNWDRIFSETAPEILESAIQMGERLGARGYRWEVTKYFLGWGVPLYLEALKNALGSSEASTLIPEFLGKLDDAIQTRPPGEESFPADELLSLVEEIKQSQATELEEAAGAGGSSADAEAGDKGAGKDTEETLEYQIAEAAFNIVRVAFTVGRSQFSAKAAGEAATWILASSCSSFLRGLEVNVGEEDAELLRPGFFSRLRHELREQYEEIAGYPLSHFLEIAGSMGRKWIQLSTDDELNSQTD